MINQSDLLLNDFDFDGDTLAIALVDPTTPVGHGTLVDNLDGTYTYTPAPGFTGFDQFKYTLSDGVDVSEEAVVVIEVVNERPTIQDAYEQTLHGQTLTVIAADGLLSTAVDYDDDSLTVTVVSAPLHAQAFTYETATGAYTYTPVAGFTGKDSFTYQVSDGLISSITATVSIDVTNSRPQAVSDLYEMSQGGTLSVASPGLLENDQDFDQDSLQIEWVGNPANGTLTWNANGSFTYTPTAGYAGTDSFSYRLGDGLDSDYGRVVVYVAGQATAPGETPTGRADYYNKLHGDTLEISASRGVLANDTDPQGDSLTAQITSGPTHGTLTLEDDGSFTYVPTDASYVGTDSFQYTASDGANTSAATVVTIELTNKTPTAPHATFSVHQGDTLDPQLTSLLDRATDLDGDDLTIALVSGVSNGTLNWAGDGTFSYSPNAGFTGTDSFTYKVNDGAVDSSTATVVIDVTNDLPTVSNLAHSVDRGGILRGDLRAGALDTDGDSLTFELVAEGRTGATTVNSDGSFTYTASTTSADSDWFTYRAFDGADWSSTMTVNISVRNTAPDATDGYFFLGRSEQLTRSITMWDPDGDPLTAQLVTGTEYGPNGGTLNFQANGTFTYVPDADFVGEDSFTFTVTDGIETSDQYTVTLDVMNYEPTVGDRIFLVSPDETLTLAAPGLLAGAWDGDRDTLSIFADDLRTNAALGHGMLTVSADGAMTYQPSGTSVGEDTFTFRVTDGAVQSEPATVTIRVVNSAPVAGGENTDFHLSDGTVAYQGAPRVFEFDLNGELIADYDGDSLTYALVDSSDSAIQSLQLSSSGHATLSVADSFTGELSFTYEVSDGLSNSDPATVSVTIGNNAPQAIGNDFSTDVGKSLQITLPELLGDDFDPDGDQITIESFTVDSGSIGSISYNSYTSTYTFQPGNDPGVASLTYTITDGFETASASVSIDVVNTAPWTVSSSYQVLRPTGANAVVDVPSMTQRSASWDSEDTVTASLVGPAPPEVSNYSSDGSFCFSTTTSGTHTVSNKVSDGRVDSDPAAITIDVVDMPGATSSQEPEKCGSFSFDGLSDSATGGSYSYTSPTDEQIASQEVNLPTFAYPDGVYQTYRNVTLSTNSASGWAPPVRLNDGDLNEVELTLSVASGPSNGSLTLHETGHFVYSPNLDYVGSDSFVYSISDGTHSSTATVSLMVVDPPGSSTPPPPDPNAPVIANDDALSWDGSDVTGNVLANDGGTSTSKYVSNPGQYTLTNGTLTLSQNGDFTYSVTSGQEDDFVASDGDTFSVTVSDSQGNTDSSDFSCSPTILLPGESYVSGSTMVVNGSTTPGSPYPYTTGISPIAVWSQDIGGVPTLCVGPVTPGAVCIIGVSGGGDVAYTGLMEPATASLYLGVEGRIVDPITIAGYCNVSCMGDVGNVQASVIHAFADGDIGNVSGTHVKIVAAGGAIGSVTASGHIAYVSAGDNFHVTPQPAGTIGSVLAAGHIGVVSSLGAVSDIGSVSAGGSIAHVLCGANITGGVSAGGDIGFTVPLRGSYGASYFAKIEEYTAMGFKGGGVVAEGEIQGSVTALSGSIGYVDGMDGISGSVLAGMQLFYVQSDEGDISGSILAGNSIMLVAGEDISGSVAAGNHIARVEAKDSITGSISAGLSIGSVTAGLAMNGSVTATTGSINYVAAGMTVQSDGKYHGSMNAGSISAGGNIGSVTTKASAGCGGLLQAGSITAGGSIIRVSSAAGLHASVSATGSIGSVTAGGTNSGDIVGSVNSADSFVQKVVSERGGINGSVTAKTDVTEVYARDDITGNVLAYNGSIQSVTSQTGDVANVVAHLSIGAVTAGEDINGSVLAGMDSNGEVTIAGASIGDVTAGNYAPGNIAGSVKAGGNIRKVLAQGGSRSFYALPSVAATQFTANYQSWLKDPNASPADIPIPPRPAALPSQPDGNIHGIVKAGGNIGGVIAHGKVAQGAEAGLRLKSVWAAGDIGGLVKSAVGQLSVTSWGSILASVDATGTADVSVYEDIMGTVTSSAGAALVGSWGAIAGSVTALKNAIVASYDSAAGQIQSLTGYAASSMVTAMQSASLLGDLGFRVLSPYTVVTGQSLGGGTSFHASGGAGGASAVTGDLLAYSLKDLTISGRTAGDANITSWGTLNATITATKSITVAAQGAAQINLVAKEGNITVSGAGVSGSAVSGATRDENGVPTAPSPTDVGAGNINVTSFGHMSASLKAGRNVGVHAVGNVTGAVKGLNCAMVTCSGDLSGTVEASSGSVAVTCWGSISSPEIKAKKDSDIYGHNGINSTIIVKTNQANFPANLRVTTWGTLSGSIEALGDVTILADDGITAQIVAGGKADITAFDDVTATITAGDRQGYSAVDTNLTAVDQSHASIVVLGALTGNVTAGGNVQIDAHGNVSGNMDAKAGSVAIAALPNDGVNSSFNGSAKAGQGVGITVAGNITAPSITAGTDVGLSAHGNISSTTVTKAGGKVEVSADAAISQLTVTEAASAEIGALTGITGATVTAKGEVNAVSFAAANVTLTSKEDKASARALGDLQGTIKGAKGASATAYGSIPSLTIESAAGPVDIWSHGTLNATKAEGGKGVSALALGELKGTYTATGGDVSLSSLADINGVTATAHNSAYAVASGAVSGTITGQHKDAGASSTGVANVSATVTGFKNASASALGGNIDGTVTATKGNASASASGSVNKAVTAGKNASVFALSNVAGAATVTAGRAATVTALGQVQATVNAGSNADVTGGIEVSGSITAGKNADVMTLLGPVSADVLAMTGYADVTAIGDITGAVTAGTRAAVFALDSVDGQVDAGTNADVTAFAGDISQTVTAGADATVFAGGDVAQNVTAGGSVTANAFGTIQGELNAGRDVNASAFDEVAGEVIAGRHANVFAFEDITGNVTATAGNATVSTFSDVNNTVTAGQNATVTSGDSTTGTISAGGSVSLTAFGPTQATITSGADTNVLSVGPLNTSVNATGSISISALADAQLSLTAGESISALSVALMKGTADAGTSASFTSLDGFAMNVTAVDSAGVWAFGSAQGVLDADGYVSATSWDALHMNLYGDEGAFAWSYGTGGGEIHSTNGFAGIVSVDSVIANVVAGTSALVAAGGTAAVTVDAGEYALAWADGALLGSIIAGDSAGAFGYGTLLVTIDAGANAVAVSAGPILGNFRAGGDIGLASYSSINAGAQADGNVAWLWSRGNIQGTYRADGSIGSVFSYGSVNANLVADQPGGTVGSVQALGSIGGTVIADTSIGTVRAGGSVNATLIAPQIATPIENDATMAAAYPLPDVPTSNMADIRARLADRKSDLATKKAEIQADVQAIVNAIADARSDAADSISAANADLAQAHSEILLDAIDDLVDVINETADDFADDRSDAAKEDNETRRKADKAKKAMKDEGDQAKTDGDKKFNESKAKTAKAKAKRDTAESEANEERRKKVDEEMAEQYRRGTDWADAMGEDALEWFKGKWATLIDYENWLANAAAAGQAKLDAMLERPRSVGDLTRSQGASEAEALYNAIGVGIADNIGLTSILSAWWGEDPVTLEKLSNTQRLFNAVTGAMDLIATGMMVYRGMTFFRGPCGGYVFRWCLPADTPVMVPAEEMIAAASSTGEQAGWNRTFVIGAGLAMAVAVVGSVEQAQRRRNLEDARRRAAVDGALANPDFLDTLWEHIRLGHL